jgi:hypothetical protein
VSSKWVHNNISWAFIVLVIIFVFWVVLALGVETAKAGGLFEGEHRLPKFLPVDLLVRYHLVARFPFWAGIRLLLV